MMWLAVVPSDLIALEALNAVHADRQLVPIAGERGGLLIGAYLLTDCGPGGYWEDYSGWLRSLQTTDEQPAPPPDQPMP